MHEGTHHEISAAAGGSPSASTDGLAREQNATVQAGEPSHGQWSPGQDIACAGGSTALHGLSRLSFIFFVVFVPERHGFREEQTVLSPVEGGPGGGGRSGAP